VAATCANTHTCGIHEGTNTDTTMLSYVSHLSPMQIGDLVLSTGQGLVFPQGFGLGRVTSSYVNGLHLTIELQPLLNLHEIHYCAILAIGNL